MDGMEIGRRLDAQERLLRVIVGMLAPEPAEIEGSGFEDLIEVLADLTEAVAEVTAAVRALRSNACAPFPQVGP